MYKTIKLLIVVCSLTIMLMLTSCKSSYYAPSMQVPLFKAKGDLQIGGYYEPKGQNYTTNSEIKKIQIAYAITNSLAIMANYNSFIDFTTVSGGYLFSGVLNKAYMGNFLESGNIALGVFKPLKHAPSIILEGYSGIGMGRVNQYYGVNFVSNYGSMKLLDSRLFIQGNIGYKRKYFELALSTKCTYVYFYNIEHDIPSFNTSDLERVNAVVSQPSNLMLEPFFTLRTGWTYIKFQLQIGGLFNLTPSKFFKSDAVGNIGLFIDLPNKTWDIFRSKKTESIKN